MSHLTLIFAAPNYFLAWEDSENMLELFVQPPAIRFGIYKHSEDVICDARAGWCGSFGMSNVFFCGHLSYRKGPERVIPP